ncbi:MAG: class IV adenylate cyclase [Bradyrhizobium sp.]
MGANIEVKAHVRDWERQRSLAAQLAGSPPETLEQVDTFFHVTDGRFKLREITATRGELIFYRRDDELGPCLSDYSVCQTHDPAQLRETLSLAMSICGEVRKKRLVFLSEKFGGRTRIHLDEVKGLGQFLELEVVLQPGQTPEDGERIAGEFRVALDIQDEDLIELAYFDLLTAHSGGGL